MHEPVAEVRAGEDFFPRPGGDEVVDHAVAGTVHGGDGFVGRAEGRVDGGGGGIGAVVKFLCDAAGLQPGAWRGEVVAAGDDDGAEPVFVSGGAVGAVAGERVLRCDGGLTGDLLERVAEVSV